MDNTQCKDAANRWHKVIIGERIPLIRYQGACTVVYSKQPDGRMLRTTPYRQINTNEEFLKGREQMEESMNMIRSVRELAEMQEGRSMVDETKVERCLRRICYSLFVTTREKGLIHVLFGYPSHEHNTIMWGMMTYPKSKNIQLYGICAIINATYCSKSGERKVADLKCIWVIVTAMKEFTTKEIIKNGVLAIENSIDEDQGNASLLVDELKNNIDFIYDVVTNNGASLLLSLTAELRNAVILELILKNSKE